MTHKILDGIKIHRKVQFRGEIYWLHGPAKNTGHYNISPLNHYDEKGNLLSDGYSFAILEPVGNEFKIARLGDWIGTIDDLTLVLY